VNGSVKFSDASAVKIKGVGSVVFKAKMGKHHLLVGLYYILALRIFEELHLQCRAAGREQLVVGD
jgi:hypothetical protein